MTSARIATLTLLLLSVALTAAAAPGKGVVRSEKVESYMVEANAAWTHLQDADLASMEATLASGLHEITDMVDSYSLHTPPELQARTNAYLSKRGWGHLVWTQIMVRLLAIRNGVYDQELEFAERVALESSARRTLDAVESSFGSFDVLLQAKDLFGFGEQIDLFAQGLFQDGEEGEDYQTIIARYRERFLERKQVVIARLESREHRGIVEPGRLNATSGYAVVYNRHRDRLADQDTRLDQILQGLSGYDPVAVRGMALAAASLSSDNACDMALDAVRVELMVFEDALDASEDDPAMQRMLELYEANGAAAFLDDESVDVDFRDAMLLMHDVRQSLADHADDEGLREFYSLGNLAR